jgi:3-dehydroquinate dehydratase-2
VTSVTIINGPNLNLLGTRKPEVYGHTTLADVEAMCVEFKQSNHEGQIIDWIHELGARVKAGTSIGLVLNPGALTHTSVAIHDAIEGAQVPTVECHISNVHKREEFRHHSFVSPVAAGIVVGFGVYGYVLGITGLHHLAQQG